MTEQLFRIGNFKKLGGERGEGEGEREGEGEGEGDRGSEETTRGRGEKLMTLT